MRLQKKYACPLRAGDSAGATSTCGETLYEGDEERKETQAKESKVISFRLLWAYFL